MNIDLLSASPFAVLWYVFLIFFSIVITINIACVIISTILKQKIVKLTRVKRFKHPRPYMGARK